MPSQLERGGGGDGRRSALVVCDLQPDFLTSLPEPQRRGLLASVGRCLRAACASEGWLVVFTGLRFRAGYAGLSEQHKLYGGLKRLNGKLGDANAHWFMEGYPGAEIEGGLWREATTACGRGLVKVVWRQQHLPPAELVEALREHGAGTVTLVGVKAGYTVQAVAQLLCDAGCFRSVTAVPECIQDDDQQRLGVILKEVLPLYCNELETLDEFLERAGGGAREAAGEGGPRECATPARSEGAQPQSSAPEGAAGGKAAAAASGAEEESGTEKGLSGTGCLSVLAETGSPAPFVIAHGSEVVAVEPAKYRYLTDCGRGGHFFLYKKLLLERRRADGDEMWRQFPSQEWYCDVQRTMGLDWMMGGKEFRCPLSERRVDFADEPRFSAVSIYLKGREHLEDKIKVLDFAAEFMPKTLVIERSGGGAGSRHRWAAPPEADVRAGPAEAVPVWFLKEADKNWGRSVSCYPSLDACLEAAEQPGGGSSFVVQQHISDPLLTVPCGRKFHVKFYILLGCAADGVTWSLHTRRDGYASISPEKWSFEDLSSDTQVTIVRSELISASRRCFVSSPSLGGSTWPHVYYPKCQAVVLEVVRRAIAARRLEGRPGQQQFEVLSADFVPDAAQNVWLLEFNLSPVVRDSAGWVTESPVGLAGEQSGGDDQALADEDEFREALCIVMPADGDTEAGRSGLRLWDHVATFSSESL